MSERTPFLLREAQLNVWLAGSDLQPLGDTIWVGGFLNSLRSEMSFEENLIKASGARYSTAHHTDELHVLEFEQSWLVQRADMADWKPGRNQQYVFQLVWMDGKNWLRRTYYGVTWRSLQQQSRDTNQFLSRQQLRAQYFNQDGGSLSMAAPQPPATLPNPVIGLEQPVGFFRENTLIAGEYLLGFYTWNEAVTVRHARAIAFAPQSSPVVLELEINGVLTGQQLTLPVGALNVEVTDEQDLSGVVAAGQLVRWKIISAPDPVDSAYNCSLVLEVSQ